MRENGLKQVSNIVKGSCAFKRGQMTLTIEDTVFMKYWWLDSLNEHKIKVGGKGEFKIRERSLEWRTELWWFSLCSENSEQKSHKLPEKGPLLVWGFNLRLPLRFLLQKISLKNI